MMPIVMKPIILNRKRNGIPVFFNLKVTIILLYILMDESIIETVIN